MGSLVSLSLSLVLLLGAATGSKPALSAEQALSKAAVYGKYSVLLKKIEVKEDRGAYSDFRDFGRWSGTSYRNHRDLPAGYWVYVWPHWYIWGKVRAPESPVPEILIPSPFEAGPRIKLEVTPRLVRLVPPVGVKRSWGPEQATGVPDTPRAGDYRTAWASKTPDGQEEWLELEYGSLITPIAILVYETYNPGALVWISAGNSGARQRDLWKGTDPTGVKAKMGISVIPIAYPIPVSRVRLHFDSKRVKGWNEIDAVGLLDAKGKTHWAVRAKASSYYGEPEVGPGMIRLTGVSPADQRIARLEAEVARLKAEIEKLKKANADRRPPPAPVRPTRLLPTESAKAAADPVIEAYPEAFFLRCYRAAGIAPEQVRIGPARRWDDRKNQRTESSTEVEIARISAEQARKFLKAVESASPRARALRLAMRRTQSKTDDVLFDAKFRIGSRAGTEGAVPVRSALSVWEAFRSSVEGGEIEGLVVQSLEISAQSATVKGLLTHRGHVDLLDMAMKKQDFVESVQRGRTEIDQKTGKARFSLTASFR